MSVRKIFIVLITIVICVILGAFVLNVIMPNTVSAIVNAVEDTIYSSTGFALDLNGDGRGGQSRNLSSTYGGNNSDENYAETGAGVEGYN